MSQKLRQDQADMIRVFSDELHVSKAALAREYGVHVDTVRNILNYKSFTGAEKKPSGQPRSLTDEQVRFIKAQARKGYKESAITKMMRGVAHKSTVRQVLEGKTYQDVSLHGQVDRGSGQEDLL